MRIVYFSRDRLEVERMRQEFVAAAIPCEVREGPIVKEAELWIKKDADMSRAFLLCVQLSVGFAKRDAPPPEIDLSESSEAA